VSLIYFRTVLRITLQGLVLLAAAGCASGPVAKIESTGDLPQELSKDLQQRYEVRDAGIAQLTSISSSSPAELKPDTSSKPTIAKKLKNKKKKGKNLPLGADEVVSTPAEALAATFPSRRPAKDPIWVGEKHIFDITYFGVQGGEFTLEVLPFKVIDGRKVYHIRGTAVSSQLFSVFYRLNDTVETFLDHDSLFSHRFHIVLDESKQTRDSLELYDQVKKQTFYWNRWNHYKNGFAEIKEFAPIAPLSHDTLSALFFLRSRPLDEGAVFTIPIVSEGKSWEAVVTVVRREMLDTPIGKVPTVVVKPEMKFQGILKKQGDSFIWLTDDDRRLVVRLEAKVKIGTVIGVLKKVEAGTPPEM